MRRNRFLRDFDISLRTIVSDDRELVSQIRTILKLPIGEHVTLTDGAGREIDAAIQSLSSNKVVFERTSEVRVIDTGFPCVLYCAIIKHDRFEYVVQKATEIGVTEIVPIMSSRTVKRHVRTARLAAIAREAVEQSGQAWMPLIREPITFVSALHEASDRGGGVVFCDPAGKDIFLHAELLSNKKISLLIGPEGGWDDHERVAAREAHLSSASLGNTTLRADTAAIVAVFIARNYLCAHS
ncbi:16S rRNA (uracil(1498)-N(3))-methyltransferase [Candidatus Uhrbacteria bacterium]|nr:16S rRNA (uracil(1498)-N(3))-methyltransferase [Candidatus Uhrbacteria bacterium]